MRIFHPTRSHRQAEQHVHGVVLTLVGGFTTRLDRQTERVDALREGLAAMERRLAAQIVGLPRDFDAAGTRAGMGLLTEAHTTIGRLQRQCELLADGNEPVIEAAARLAAREIDSDLEHVNDTEGSRCP